MNVVLSPKAAKYLEKMNDLIKGRVKNALKKLESDPPQGDIKSLTGAHHDSRSHHSPARDNNRTDHGGDHGRDSGEQAR